ncbi:MAG: FKBP-type peptidyl-prolyl cis-trans isomerase [Treponema sp.]|jgi:FKBP-type peptidyl-prolyl cis-trans isomerase FkpA|nr:FKBP-type peptidyl-prolyl cis-trans isomerase [Treponema sp.]
MKQFLFFLLILFAAFSLHAKGIAEETALAGEKADTSYAFGLVIGGDLKTAGLEFDYAAFSQGLRDAVEGGEPRFSAEEAVEMVQTAFRAAMEKKAVENQAVETRYLLENGQKDGIITTESGLQYEVITEGEGEKPGAGDTVKVNYEGTLTDGRVFDSSWERGEPAELPIGAVIPGWSEGVRLMTVGSTYRFFIPSSLAYGPQGAGQLIPPYSTLIFKVELLEILPGEADADGEAEAAEGETAETGGD